MCHPCFSFQYILTRDVFEKLNEDLFDQIVHTIDFVLVESDIRMEVLEHVILCGGSTRIPALRHKIQQLFDGRLLNQQINADEAVAEGAGTDKPIKSDRCGSDYPVDMMSFSCVDLFAIFALAF